MKKVIKSVLEKFGTQTNLGSESARERITDEIVEALHKNDNYLYEDEVDEGFVNKRIEDSWKCELCNGSTYNLDYDYIGSGTNHLSCEIRYENDMKAMGKAASIKEWPGLDTISMDREVLQKQIYNELTTDGLPAGGDTAAVFESHKLAEEIIENREKYIYESPDGGKTVFRRKFGDYDIKNKEEIDWETKEPTGRKFTEYPFKDKE
jgi:hypothetical protein